MGGLKSMVTGDAPSGSKPDKENYTNPYTGQFLKYLGVQIDDWMKKQGFDVGEGFQLAPGERPNPNGAKIAKSPDYDKEMDSDGNIITPESDEESGESMAETLPIKKLTSSEESPDSETNRVRLTDNPFNYKQANFAAALKAKDAGVEPETLALDNRSDISEEDQGKAKRRAMYFLRKF